METARVWKLHGYSSNALSKQQSVLKHKGMSTSNESSSSSNDESKQNARLNVLYSPFRKRDVNPQDWESKMLYWRNNITNWCVDSNHSVFSLPKLQSAFLRNGRPASCLNTVVEEMLRGKEVISLQDLMNTELSSKTWSAWAVDLFVKTPMVWTFTKLKESLVSNTKNESTEDFVHLSVLKRRSSLLEERCKNDSKNKLFGVEEIKSILKIESDLDLKVTLHWLQLEGQAAVTTLDNKTIVKLSEKRNRATLTEADIGLYRLQQNEQALMKILEQLEVEKQQADQEARNYINKGMRHAAKRCLRKKKEIDSCINKRENALGNMQVLISRVRDAESDGEIVESYRLGLAALKATFKDAGLSEDNVNHTMDQVREVLEVQEEVQSALSEPMEAGVDEDLEKELAELLSGKELQTRKNPVPEPKRELFDELPEPPSHLPSISVARRSAITLQGLLH